MKLPSGRLLERYCLEEGTFEAISDALVPAIYKAVLTFKSVRVRVDVLSRNNDDTRIGGHD